MSNHSTPSRSSRTISQVVSERRGSTPSRCQPTTSSINALIEDFKTLYRDQILSDFELRSEGVSFPAHKAILYARSPFFRAKFTADNLQGIDSQYLEITDLEPHTLNRMLLFMYSSSLDQDLHIDGLCKLYYAAHKYRVESLKQVCSSRLQSRISVSNVSRILELAHTHQDDELKSFVNDFMLLHFDDIICSDEWGYFLEANPLLAGKTMHQICKRQIIENRIPKYVLEPLL